MSEKGREVPGLLAGSKSIHMQKYFKIKHCVCQTETSGGPVSVPDASISLAGLPEDCGTSSCFGFYKSPLMQKKKKKMLTN